MNRLLAAALLSLSITAPAMAGETPWEPSKGGKIECFGSNLAAKTCASMTVYRWLDGTNVEAETRGSSDVLRSGVVVLSSRHATIKGDSNCTVALRADTEANSFEFDGRPVSEDEALKFRARMTDNMRENFGRIYCLRIGKYGREYTAQLTIDGREMPTDANWMAWIDKADGFTLSP